MDSTLIAGKSQIVTRAQLAGIPAPASTATWRPFTHTELLDLMEDRLEAAGYSLAREQYAIQTQGLKLFATWDLKTVIANGLSLAIGFRHGNDKSMALQMVAGPRVTVCDNLSLIGETKLFRNKHKHGVFSRLREALGRYFGSLTEQVETVQDRLGVWQAAELTDDRARVLIYKLLEGKVIPGRLRPEVHTNYFEADRLGYTDSAPRSVWGLSNAVTRAIKALNPGPAFEANVGLTRVFSEAVS